ncbi:Uncharacterised protein [Escherichia coli]|nr:Uncharacterised protein [Escherichia coli]
MPVTRRARHVVNNNALFTKNTVSECRLTYVRTTHNRQFDRQTLRVEVVFLFFSPSLPLQIAAQYSASSSTSSCGARSSIQAAAHAPADLIRHDRETRRSGRFHLTKRVEINHCLIGIQTVSFVCHQKVGFSRERRCLGNRFICRHQARARIHHKQYDVRFFNRQQRLFRHAGFLHPSSVPSIPPVSIR